MNALQNQLYETKHVVDTNLKQYITNGQPHTKDLLECINYSLYSGGKRLRPLFCFFVGEIFEVPKEKLLSVACALEMIHTASLIMDDLPHMDDAELRRGKLTNHLVYGQDVATLASIGLLTKAYEIVLTDPRLSDSEKTKVVTKLATAVGVHGLVGGQFVDLHVSNGAKDRDALDFIHTHKTSSLFVASGSTAAIIGDASEDEIKAVEQYANNLGFAYQILDDILDATGKTDEVGKTLGNDDGNFVTLYGADKSKQLVDEYTERAMAALAIFNGKSEQLIVLGKVLLHRNS